MRVPPHPFGSRAPVRPLDLALALGLGLALLLTLQGVLQAPPTRTALSSAGPVPLLDRWTSMANGDRANRMVRDGAELWVASEGGGLILWNVSDRTYRQWLAPQDGLLSNNLRDLLVTADAVWLASDRGLSRMDRATAAVRHFTPATSAGMPASLVNALARRADGKLWVGFGQVWDPALPNPQTSGGKLGGFRPGGIALFDPVDFTWSAETHAELADVRGPDGDPLYKSIPSENVTALAVGTDGLLWVGTRPYFKWSPDACPNGTCADVMSYWVQSGGGLAASNGTSWMVWRASESTPSCYSNEITALASDRDGRMWAATLGEGVLLMKDGLRRLTCDAQPGYHKVRKVAGLPAIGLRGDHVWAVDVDDRGRVWIANGPERDQGGGIAILDHHGSFGDSNNAPSPFQTDDTWTYVDLDGVPGSTDTLISALAVGQPGLRYLGTRFGHGFDGDGLRAVTPELGGWQSLRTSDTGLPSNEIAGIARDTRSDVLYLTFRNRGVARYDPRATNPKLVWRWWRAFQPGRTVAHAVLLAAAGASRVTVDLADTAAYDAAFPSGARQARIGLDPTLYRVVRYLPAGGTDGPQLELSPALRAAAPPGTSLFTVERGPAGDASTGIAVDGLGRVWAGARETIWQNGGAIDVPCPSFPNCWLDGGLSRWDGSIWSAYTQQNSTIPDQDVQSVAVDKVGQVWIGTGDGMAKGSGIGILDPARGSFTSLAYGSGGFAGGGVADLDVDAATGDVWAAQNPVEVLRQNPGGSSTREVKGGGVARFASGVWTTWTKDKNRGMKAYGTEGTFRSILVDRTRDVVWAGAFDAASTGFHWLSGRGVNAALNWCGLASCSAADWQAKVWPDDGEVAALALDDSGNLWAGTNRGGRGLLPPESGIKLYDGATWRTVTTANSGLSSNEITALAADAGRMWVGTLRNGLSLYEGVPPTPTPTPTATSTAIPSSTRTATSTEVPSETPTPEATATEVPTDEPTQPPVTPGAACDGADGGGCPVYLPVLYGGGMLEVGAGP